MTIYSNFIEFQERLFIIKMEYHSFIIWVEAVANQIDTQGLIKSEEQIQQETQQAQQQQFAQQSLADPRVAIEMGKQLANSNVSPSVDGEGNVQLNQGE